MILSPGNVSAAVEDFGDAQEPRLPARALSAPYPPLFMASRSLGPFGSQNHARLFDQST